MDFLADLMTGDVWVAALALCALGLVSLGERYALSRHRWMPYFSIGVPLYPRLVPIPLRPEGEGTTFSVAWEVDDELDIARFWADPAQRTAPRGLHGFVRFLSRRDGQIALEVVWSPPWLPFLAMAWLAGIGLARGDGLMSVPLAAMLCAVLSGLYYQTARRAAAELRYAWTGAADPEVLSGSPGMAPAAPWAPQARHRSNPRTQG